MRLVSEPLNTLDLKNRVDNLQDMIAKLISAVSQKSKEIDLIYRNSSGQKIKLKNVHEETTLKELYYNIIPHDGNLKFLKFGNKVFDPNVLTCPDGELRTVESAVTYRSDYVELHDGNFEVKYSIGKYMGGSTQINLNPDFFKEALYAQIEEHFCELFSNELKEWNYPVLKVAEFETAQYNDFISHAVVSMKIMATLDVIGDEIWSSRYSVDLSSKPTELFHLPLNFYCDNRLLSNYSTWIDQGVKHKSKLRVEESAAYNSQPCAFILIFNDGRMEVTCSGGFSGKKLRNVRFDPDSELFIATIKKELEKVNARKLKTLNWPKFHLRIIGKQRMDMCLKIFAQIHLVSQIELVDSNNQKPTQMFEVDLCSKVSNLAEELCCLKLCHGKKVLDPSCAWIDQDIKNLDRLMVEYYSNRLVINSRIGGKVFSIEYKMDDTVYDVMKKIQRKLGLGFFECIRLLFDGERLLEKQTMRECGIYPGDTIDVIMAMRGGMYHSTSGRQSYEPLAMNHQLLNGLPAQFDYENADLNELNLDQLENLTAFCISSLKSLKKSIE
jgi:hypothetical protein